MKKVVTVCPYCASGCKIHLVVDNGKIVRAEGRAGKTNPRHAVSEGVLRLGFINDANPHPAPENPMIRREARQQALKPSPGTEALDYVATRLCECIKKYGPDAKTTGSSRGTGNETNYVMQNSRARYWYQ